MRNLICTSVSLLLLVALSCQQERKKPPVVLHVLFDRRSDVAPWIDRAERAFHGKKARTSSRRGIWVATYESKNFRELLGRLDTGIKPELVVLNASFEKAFVALRESDLGDGHSLASTSLVLVTRDHETSHVSGPRIDTLKSVLEKAREEKIKLLAPDPAQSPVGLAALILWAYVEGVLVQQGGDIDKGGLDQLLKWLSRSVVFSEFKDPATFGAQGNVAVVSEARCLALRQSGVSIEAAYPREGTIELDYPAFIPRWASGEEREAAEIFLSFLKSPEMQHLKETVGLDLRCADGSLRPRIMKSPQLRVVAIVFEAWLRRTKG